MKTAVKNSLSAVLAVALLATTACRREPRNENPDTPSPAIADAAVPALSTTSTADHAEVFRRAFWRHPTSADLILNAERRVSSDKSGESWQWFIQLHPSPELLAALRDPETLGLLRLPPDATPRPWPTAPEPPPAWFPVHESPDASGYEILQTPGAGLTVLYRSADNMLFATDTGSGFAPALR